MARKGFGRGSGRGRGRPKKAVADELVQGTERQITIDWTVEAKVEAFDENADLRRRIDALAAVAADANKEKRALEKKKLALERQAHEPVVGRVRDGVGIDHGIDHGIVQASHWRFRPHLPVQICSIQTVAKRRWPDAQLIVVDEAHTVTETVKKRITPRDTITIGLTATPFTKGLGKLYDAVINVTTTNRLIEQGWLAPYRIFACVEPNMDGVRVVAGEYEESETSKRALQVVGDVVQEYMRHGEGRKFICSAVDVAHVEELQRQFLAQGVLLRPLGNTVYVMPPYCISSDDLAQVYSAIRSGEEATRAELQP